MEDAKICLRMRGQGSGQGFQAHLVHLQGLKVCDVRRVRIEAVDDHDPHEASCVNMDITVPLLDTFSHAGQLDIHNWYTDTIGDLGHCFETCPRVHILHYAASKLDFSRNTAGQVVHVANAPGLTSIRVSRHTVELDVKRAAALRYISAPAGAALKVLTLSRCNALHVHTFLHVTDLTLTHCTFVGPNPMRDLKDSLCRLTFSNIAGAAVLHLKDFSRLVAVTVGECEAMMRICVLECAVLRTLSVSRCNALRTLRCGSAAPCVSGPSILRGMPCLDEFSLRSCARMSVLIIEDMPVLRVASMSRCQARDVLVDGRSCPMLDTLDVGLNAKLRHGSLHLMGSFPKLVYLKAGNRFTKLPARWVMPALRVLILTRTRFRDPLDLSMFPALSSIQIEHNSGPSEDVGGQPFQLSVIAAPGVPPELIGEKLVLVTAGVTIPRDRLAPSQNDEGEAHASDTSSEGGDDGWL